MSEKQAAKMVIGLKHQMIDAETGVPSEFHSLDMLVADMVNGVHSVTISHYFSKDLFDLGKKPFGQTRYEIYGMPPRGVDMVDWMLQTLAAPISDDAVDVYGQPLQPNPLTGAELVYRDIEPLQQ